MSHQFFQILRQRSSRDQAHGRKDQQGDAQQGGRNQQQPSYEIFFHSQHKLHGFVLNGKSIIAKVPSAGWPVEAAPGEDVQMQMRHRLARIRTVVDDQSKTVLVESLLAGDLPDHEQHVS